MLQNRKLDRMLKEFDIYAGKFKNGKTHIIKHKSLKTLCGINIIESKMFELVGSVKPDFTPTCQVCDYAYAIMKSRWEAYDVF